MDQLLMTGIVGVGMFLLGFFTHTWIASRGQGRDDGEAIATSRWKCPTCSRVKELPQELDQRVLVCNNCNKRLVRLLDGAA